MRLEAPLTRRTRGAAAVEMAISMLVLVPVFLYALFLDDLLRYSLDAQEAALSTGWDFTVRNYARPFEKKYVQRHARLMFCDHESGIDSYKMKSFSDGKGGSYQRYPDCEGTDHHQALAAHVCWLNDNAKQVTCSQPEKDAASLDDPLHRSFQGAFTHGGLIKCHARAVVENYLLPKAFLQEFSKVGLTKEQWQGKGREIHDNAQKGKEDNAYFLKQEQLAILTDTWAVTLPADVRPDDDPSAEQTGERSVWKLLHHVYTQNEQYEEMKKDAGEFLEGLGNGLLSKDALPKGEEGLIPRLAIKPLRGAGEEPIEKIKQDTGSRSYFNTEWEDWDKNHTRETYKGRKAGYLGCNPGEGC